MITLREPQRRPLWWWTLHGWLLPLHVLLLLDRCGSHGACLGAPQPPPTPVVWVASSVYVMTVSPTVASLRPETVQFLQVVAVSALQATAPPPPDTAQATTDTTTATTTAATHYLVNTTKVVEQSTDFYSSGSSSAAAAAVNPPSTTEIRFFVLAAAVWDDRLPAGSAFREVRKQASFARQTALNDWIERALAARTSTTHASSTSSTSSSSLLSFVDRIHKAVNDRTSNNHSSGSYSLLSDTVAAQLLAVANVTVTLQPDNATNNETVSSSSTMSSTDQHLSNVDIVLLVLSGILLVAVGAVAVQYHRDRRASRTAEPLGGPASTTTTTTTTAPFQNNNNNDKHQKRGDRKGEVDMEAGRSPTNVQRRTDPDLTLESVSSSSLASFFSPLAAAAAADNHNRRIVVASDTEPWPSSTTTAAADAADTPAEIILTCSSSTSAGSAAGLARLLAVARTLSEPESSQSSSSHSGWTTGSGNSSHGGGDDDDDAQTKAALYATSLATTVPYHHHGLLGATPSPFAELIHQILTEPLVGPSLAERLCGGDQDSGRNWSEPIEGKFCLPADGGARLQERSTGKNEFHEEGRSNSSSGGSNSSSVDLLHVDVNAASTNSPSKSNKHSKPTTISEWMKNTCVESSGSVTDTITLATESSHDQTMVTSVTHTSSMGGLSLKSLEPSVEDSVSGRRSDQSYRRRRPCFEIGGVAEL